ncbi:MAG: pknB 11 [Gemmataceae bacterium]|nr:pknB 11 [Gemmataceae bacterium]
MSGAPAADNNERESGWRLRHVQGDEPTSHLDTPIPSPGGCEGSDDLAIGSSRLLCSEPDLVERFPRPGDRFLHFDLVEELGRGAFARVYLAKQQVLAHRLVVLKLTTTRTDEAQRLARLRHTNVVPVYSVHDTGQFQAVCMPYLGRLTLAHLIDALPPPGRERPRSGHALLTPLLADLRPGRPGRPPEPLDTLDRMSFADTALWLVAQLAGGLAHAHNRCILHRDLKPANVLVTADGVPMILDFNVSAESARTAAGGRIGGTVTYMAPEHLRAFAGVDQPVDERSDLYSLGVILYQLLTGQLPHPVPHEGSAEAKMAAMIHHRRTPPPEPSSLNRAVTPATDAIVLKLLDPVPDRRYQRAGDLHEDLTRQLANHTLRFAPDRSVRERGRKWRRRHPRAATSVVVAGVALLFLLIPAGVIAGRQSELAARAREIRRSEAVVGYQRTIDDLQTAAVQLGSRADPAFRDQGLTLAKDVLDRYAVTTDPGWEARPAVALLDPAQKAALKAALGEILVLMTRAEIQRAGPDPGVAAEAGRWNELAGLMFTVGDRPTVIDRQREELEHLRAGIPPPSRLPKPGPAREADLYFDGLDLATAGRYQDALRLLTPSCARRPDTFLAWFARGVCHDALGQSADAATAFAVCVVLRPDSAHAHLNRGLAHLKLRRFPEAEADFTRALELKPGWTVALLDRGLARDGLREFHAAEADFTAALADPVAPARLLFLRSKVRRAAGDTAGADADRAAGMARPPADALSWSTRGTWRMNAGEFDAAVADFDAALRINPAARDALLNKAVVLADYRHREAEAIPVFDRLLELAPDQVDARASRGVYLARLGRAAEARRDAADALRVDQSAYRLFQVAGLFAQLSKVDPKAKDEALKHLSRALRAGFNNPHLLKTDTDLDPIRDHPEFARIVAAIGQLDLAGR